MGGAEQVGSKFSGSLLSKFSAAVFPFLSPRYPPWPADGGFFRSGRGDFPTCPSLAGVCLGGLLEYFAMLWGSQKGFKRANFHLFIFILVIALLGLGHGLQGN